MRIHSAFVVKGAQIRKLQGTQTVCHRVPISVKRLNMITCECLRTSFAECLVLVQEARKARLCRCCRLLGPVSLHMLACHCKGGDNLTVRIALLPVGFPSYLAGVESFRHMSIRRLHQVPSFKRAFRKLKQYFKYMEDGSPC